MGCVLQTSARSYYVHPQMSDGIGPPVPNRDFSKTTEVIYDNKVTTETNEPSEYPGTNEETSRPADAKEEKSTVVEGDTKSENCVENDICIPVSINLKRSTTVVTAQGK